MIPRNFIEQWRINAPWQTISMIEQDLVISRALVDLYRQPKITESLAFRGGTALNKLFIKPATRYSEDIDLVQINPEPIGETVKVIRGVLDQWLGQPKSKLTKRSTKLIYRYQSEANIPAKLKIEINTTEHFHIRPLKRTYYSVKSEWFTGYTDIVTYHLEELMATKLCALYQRSKGRDLFDLWLVRKQNLVNLNEVLAIFKEYNLHIGTHITRAMFEQSLSQKQDSKDFIDDTSPLLEFNSAWNFAEAFEMVMNDIVGKLPGEPWKGVEKIAS